MAAIRQRLGNELAVGRWRDRIETTGENQRRNGAGERRVEVRGQERTRPAVAGRETTCCQRWRAQRREDPGAVADRHARCVLRASHRVVQGKIHGLFQIAGKQHRGGQQRRKIAGLGATEQRRYEARQFGRVHEPMQCSNHGIETQRNLAQHTGTRIGDGDPVRRAERDLDLPQGCIKVGIRAFANRVFAACCQNFGERGLARGPDVEHGSHCRWRDAVEHHAADARGVTAHEFLRDSSAVGAAPKIDAFVAQRRANRVDVGDDFRRGVARDVDVIRSAQLAQFSETSLRGGRRQIGVDQLIERVARRQRGAFQRRRFAGAARIDEHDVAGAAYTAKRDRHGNQCLRRLTGSAGEHEQGVGIGAERVGGQHRNGQRKLAASGLGAVLGHLDGGALRGRRELGQAALVHCDVPRQRPVAAGAKQQDEQQ